MKKIIFGLLLFIVMIVPIESSAQETAPISPVIIENRTIDGGVFVIMLLIGIICFVLSIKYGTALIIITVIVMFSLGISLIAEYDVIFTETVSVNSDIFVTTKCLICNNGSWLGWTIFAFGIISAMFFTFRQFRGQS